jgi:DNA polymerase-1
MALGIYPAPIFDTMLAGELLRSSGGASRVNLAALTKHYLNIEISKDEQKSDWSNVLSESQINYAARDADILLKLREVMVGEIYKNELSEIALIEFSCVHAMALIEYSGISIDIPRWDKLLSHTESERDKALDVLYTYTERPLVQMNLWGEEITEHHNFDSNPFVLKLLKANGINTKSTSKQDLAPYAKHPLVKVLTDYRKSAKLLSSFLHPIPKMLNRKTGRLHPHYAQIGAWSGRGV